MTAHAFDVRSRKMTSIFSRSSGCLSRSSVESTSTRSNFLLKPLIPASWSASALSQVTISVRLAGKCAKYHLCAHSDHTEDRNSCAGRMPRNGSRAGGWPMIIQTVTKPKQSVTVAASIWLYTISWMRPTSIKNAS